MTRKNTRTVWVGGRPIGGGNPILIQSMCNTKTEDVRATVEQILRLEQKGEQDRYIFGFEESYGYLSGGYVRECDIVAVVDHCADGWLYGTQRNRFAVGDEVEILEPGQPPYKLTVAEIRNGEGEPVPAAPHAMMEFSMPCPNGTFTQGTIIRKNKM